MTRDELKQCMVDNGFEWFNNQYNKRLDFLRIWVESKETYKDGIWNVKIRCGMVFNSGLPSICLMEKFKDITVEQLNKIAEQGEQYNRTLNDFFGSIGKTCQEILKIKKK